MFVFFVVVLLFCFVVLFVFFSTEQYDADMQRNFINPVFTTSPSYYDGQITPPTGDSAMWRRSRDLSRYVGRQISKSFSRSQSNMMND